MLYGIILGITYIIPGLCSASMAITLGIYHDLLDIFSSFYNIKTIKKHFLLIIGMILGIIIAIFIFLTLFESFNYIFLSFFIGVISTSLFKKEELKIIKKKNILIVLITIICTLLFDTIGNIRMISFDEEYLVFTYIFVFLIAILSSLALVLPGISGAMVLFVFGVYDVILKSFKDIINFLNGTQPLLEGQIAFFVVFLVGFLVGILVFSKIIDKFSTRFPSLFIAISKGFLWGSFIILLVNLGEIVVFNWTFLVCILVAISGSIFVEKILKKVT